MQSLLIISKDQNNSLDYAMSLCKKNKIDTIDINAENFEKTIGIEDIRNIQKRLFLKPIKSEIKCVIINASSGLTTEAQNALLKVLEEPPANTIIIVTATSKDFFLPTILSRCKIIVLKETLQELSDREISIYQNIIKWLVEDEVGKKMKLAQDLGKTREESLIWLEQILTVIRKKMIDEISNSSENNKNFSSSYYLYILKKFQKTHTIIKTSNVNQRFALENLFLSL